MSTSKVWRAVSKPMCAAAQAACRSRHQALYRGTAPQLLRDCCAERFSWYAGFYIILGACASDRKVDESSVSSKLNARSSRRAKLSPVCRCILLLEAPLRRGRSLGRRVKRWSRHSYPPRRSPRARLRSRDDAMVSAIKNHYGNAGCELSPWMEHRTLDTVVLPAA